MSLAKEYNQDNLVAVTRNEFLKIKDMVNYNYFLDIMRDSYFMRDRQVTIHKNGYRIFMVSHYESKHPEPGLRVVYKVDKELLDSYHKKMVMSVFG